MSLPMRQRAQARPTQGTSAGFRHVQDVLPQMVANLCDAAHAKAQAARDGDGLPVPDRQGAAENCCATLTGRHRAPTGAPMSTQVRVGGEGTPSREDVAQNGVTPADWRFASACWLVGLIP